MRAIVPRERPLPFSVPMVKATLDGTKGQTRRVVIGEPLRWLGDFTPGYVADRGNGMSPYGFAGDRLWVREAFRGPKSLDHLPPRAFGPGVPLWYEAGGKKNITNAGERGKYRPSMFMPRWASRITLEVISVRIERLQEITEAEALDEGVRGDGRVTPTALAAYRLLWDELNAARGYRWLLNPWVWVVEFKKVDA